MFIAGITGPSASGKTHLISLLQHELKEKLCVLSQDMYYLPREMQQKDEKGYENFDLPESIDQALFMAHLNELRDGKAIQQKRYTYKRIESTAEIIEVRPAPILLVEGIFIPAMPALEEFLQYRIYMDASPALKYERRLERDQRERGYTAAEIQYRYQMHLQHAVTPFLEPWRHKADRLIVNEGDLKTEASELVRLFRQKTNS